MRATLKRVLPMCVFLGLCLLSACARKASVPVSLDANHRFRPTAQAVISSPTTHDWNSDGVLEIAIGSWDGYFYLLDAQLRDLPGWPKYSPRGYFASPALADLDADGAPEIIVGADIGFLHAWRFDGRALPGFPVFLGNRSWSSATALSDGRLALGSLRRTLLLNAHGRSVRGWPQRMPNWADSTVAAAPDLLAVATLQVGAGTRGALCAWRLDGTPLPWSPLRLTMDSDSSPALADLDRDGQLEIIVGDDEGWLHVIGLDGRELPGFPQQAQSLIEASPAIGDLDGDGWLDIVVGSWDGRLYVWDHRGRSLPGWPVQVDDQIISSAALVDLDADDRLDIVVGSKDHKLYGWNARAQALPGFPVDLGHAVFSSPWVGDLEGDGRADIVVGANNGVHLLRNVGPLGRVQWAKFHRDAQNSGYVP